MAVSLTDDEAKANKPRFLAETGAVTSRACHSARQTSPCSWDTWFDRSHCRRSLPTVETVVWHSPNPLKRVDAAGAVRFNALFVPDGDFNHRPEWR